MSRRHLIPWAGIPLDLDDGPMFGPLSLAARGLFASATAWSMRHGTDGIVPYTQIPRFGRGATALADELERAGVWRRASCGFQDCVMMLCNRTRAERDDARNAGRQRQDNHRLRATNDGLSRVTNALVTLSEVEREIRSEIPPVAPPSLPAAKPERAVRAKPGTRIPEAWTPSDALAALGTTLAGTDARALVDEFRDFHTSRGSTMKDWDAAFRTWCRNHRRFSGSRGNPPRGQQPSASGRTWEPGENDAF